MLCKKCGRREATQQDGLCDPCRFMKRLDDAIREKKEEDAKYRVT